MYKGDEPFVHFIRKYFTTNKKYGSKDRKTISSLCYQFFRTAHAFKHKSEDDKLLYAIFLCEQRSNELLHALQPDLDEKIALPLKEKLVIAGISADDLFPFNSELSIEIEKTSFNLSMLVQPSLFLRSRPGKRALIREKLSAAGIPFVNGGDDSFELPNASKLDGIITLNRQAVIQDHSSQQVLNFIKDHPAIVAPGDGLTVWDCCAASGGKSILLIDQVSSRIKLTVSDIRNNILINCKERLRSAGINIHNDFIADLSQGVPLYMTDNFDIIICDAPCSGSGTWGRSPEQLSYFDLENVGKYQLRQKSIALHAFSRLTTRGVFIYITCSVFKKENEQVTEYISSFSGGTLLFEQYYRGYNSKADTLYVSVFTK